ncbi:cation diffusion facilitator family transporter [Hoyosella subflava]|uniref:Cation diffusion facilitator family transporter n=1 Tax=Hoyosella subflava (strain DSM 45089 / JCM 17490 / NBRC 109087 / DQS3-9A1) TaxID=443218 RepID=F6EMS9_HOYSD|nr:cation diffusion facilitator family transporter [Hoyosella subflava]AEF42821.1 Cation diffusion facilitator family transporter [Hoyosella subflava DQS3-9A1]
MTAEHGHGHGHGGVRNAVREFFVPHSHDHADRVDDALTSSQIGIRAVKISLVALGATALLQLVIVVISGSVALFADTVHNFADAMTAVPLWIAFVLGRRAATRKFNYGYGRAEDLAGLFIVAMIALSALIAGFESIRRLINPVAISHIPWVAAAGVIGFIGNELVAMYRIRVGRRIGSAALVADGYHARTDGFTSLAVVAGAAGAALGYDLADPIVGLLITAAIVAILFASGREVLRRLLDGIDPSIYDTALDALRAAPDTSEVRSLRIRWIGHEMHAETEVDIAPECTLAEAHEIAHRAERRIKEALPRVSAAVVHAYPAHGRVRGSSGRSGRDGG